METDEVMDEGSVEPISEVTDCDSESQQLSTSQGSADSLMTEEGRKAFYENFIEKAKLRQMDVKSFIDFTKLVLMEPVDERKKVLHNYMINQLLPIMPLKANNDDWMMLFEALHSICLEEEGLTLFDMEAAYMKCINKLGQSFAKATRFWTNFRRLYICMKDEGLLSESEVKEKIISMFQMQFQWGYLGVSKDYELVIQYLKNKNWLDQDLKLELQGIFYYTASEEESSIEKYPEFSQPDQVRHHVEFEDFLLRMVQSAETCQYDRIQVLCEELICAEPSSLCWYWVYLTVLSHSKLSAAPNLDQVMINIFHRASLHLKYDHASCFALHERFWEMSLLTVEKVVSSTQLEGFIGKLLSDVSWTNGSKRCFHSRKGILLCAKELIDKGSWKANQLTAIFESCIAPVTDDVYRRIDYILPDEFGNRLQYVGFLLELLNLYVLLYARVHSLTQNDMISMWRSYFTNQGETSMLIYFVDFVRQHGTIEQTREALDQALTQVLPDLNDSQHRIGYVNLIRKKVEFLAENGPLRDYIEIHNKYVNLHCKFAFDYADHYDDDKLQHFSFKSSPPTSDLEIQSRSPSQGSLADRMDILELPTNGTSSRKGKGYPLFMVNLNYKTTNRELVEAFTRLEYNVVKVDVRRNRKGHNQGYGTIYLESEKSVNDAINRYSNVLRVGDRTLSLEAHKTNAPSTSKQARTYDSILLEVVPIANFNEAQIMEVLAPHGQVMSIRIMNPIDDPVYCQALVRYNYFEDIEVAYNMWKGGKIFAHTGIKMSKTRAGKWANLTEPPVASESEKSMGPKVGSKRPHTHISAPKRKPAPQLTATNTLVSFVPTQVRRTQARRLEMPSDGCPVPSRPVSPPQPPFKPRRVVMCPMNVSSDPLVMEELDPTSVPRMKLPEGEVQPVPFHFVDSSLGPRPLPQRVAMWLWEEDPKPLPLPLKNRLRTMRGVDFRRQYLPPSKSPEAQEPQVEEPLASTSKFVPQKPPRSKSFEPKRVNTYVLDIHDPPEGPKLKRPRMDLETPCSTTSNPPLLTAELNSSQYRSSVASSEPACGQLPMYVLESENMRVTYPDPLFSRKKGKDLPSLNANLEADLDSDSDSLIYFRSEMPKRVTMHLSINQTSSEDEAMEDGPAVQMNEELEFSEEQDKSQMSGSRSCDSPRLSPPPLKRILLADKKPNKE